ncbi:hypothetical protein CCMA1212_006535 [Trichoderma ghanense]|uniref:Uncharacterized protein n=1 Tax=Trichoderma ghanense TaxID=65468 RepID=A0ABY2H065_9HYPO
MSDYRSLMTLAGNISTVSLDDIILSSMPLTVATRMKPWLKRSAFHRIFTYGPPYSETEEQAASSSTKARDMEHRSALVQKLLDDGISAVNSLSFCFQGHRDVSAMLRQLREVMRLVHERLDADIPAEDQYRLVYRFTAWVVKNSAASYVSLSAKDPFLLVFLLHMYSVVVTLTAALPRVDVPLFAKFRVSAIVEICSILREDRGFLCQRCNGVHAYEEVMKFPLT